MQALYDKVVEVLLSHPRDRMGINRRMHERVHMVPTTLRSMYTGWHNPMGEAVQLRGEVAEGLFR